MVIEVVAVGTELLLGQVVNSNAATIGAALAAGGLDAHFQQVVGDNEKRIADCLQVALERSDGVIVTGGIGPTQDDLTREALARLTGRPLVRNVAYVEELERRFARLGRDLPPSNLRQADHPEGSIQLPNPKGTAPGIYLEHRGRPIFVLPGVPEEMEWMLHHEVMPRLARYGEGVVVSRVVRTWGLPESAVAEILDDLYRGSTNPSIAFLASGGEIKVRITAKSSDPATAQEMIDPVESEVRRRLGDAVFGVDDETVEEVLHRELAERGWTVGTAESATGGLVAARITSVPGSSQVFRGSLVAYAADLKERLLAVHASTVDRHGVVSEETAIEMALGARGLLSVDVAIAVTGSAGPDPQEQEVGTMVLAVSTPEDTAARTLRLPGDRERVRTYAATAALHLARRAVTGVWWKR
jgi:nicotinamide-nucleotide amidase